MRQHSEPVREIRPIVSISANTHACSIGFKINEDGMYPPSRIDWAPIMCSIEAAQLELVLIGSYPPDALGVINGTHEVDNKARMFGGAPQRIPPL